jgi:hypothetical protein
VANASRITVCSAVAAACVVAGGGAVTLAVIAGPAPGLTGYVSEAGITSSAFASTYRFGVLGLAAAMVLFAVTLPTALRLAGALLAASAASTVTSALVTCSNGCPLPPYDRVTLADVVHGGASVVGVAGCVFAMLALALSPRAAPSLRRLSRATATVALPLSAAVGLAMLLIGRSALVGLLERLLLTDVALWALASVVTIGIRGGAGTAVTATAPATQTSTGPRSRRPRSRPDRRPEAPPDSPGERT